MIQTQRLADQNLLALVETVKKTFSFAKNLEKLPTQENFNTLKEIINQILQQTGECAFFIREYVSRRFLSKYTRRQRYFPF